MSTFAVAVLFPVTFLSQYIIPDSPRRVSLQLSKPVAVTVFLYHSYFQSPVIFYMNFTFSGGASELTLIVLFVDLFAVVFCDYGCEMPSESALQHSKQQQQQKKKPNSFLFFAAVAQKILTSECLFCCLAVFVLALLPLNFEIGL